jgi:hypothetical protein
LLADEPAEDVEMSRSTPQTYLLPIADREPLAWIVLEQRTAFGEHRRREACALEVGDVLLLYTTRGCFRNPTRDRGRVIGRAVVASPGVDAKKPPAFGGRTYPIIVGLAIESLAPLGQGVELAPLVARLRSTFPDPKTWSVRMRRALVPIEARDAAVIDQKLSRVVRPYEDAVAAYGRGSDS